jgi:enamine deaminase RidA (YjgF/YER057c/UK114 family)
MPKKCFNAPELSKPVAYSHAVRAGDTIYIGGLISRDMDNNIVGVGDFPAQVEQVYWSLEAVLRAADASLANVVKLNAFVTRREHIQVLREIRAKWFPKDPPTHTLVLVDEIAVPDCLIEMEAIAAVG